MSESFLCHYDGVLTDFLFLIKKTVYFLAVLGLRCCTWALSSHGKSGLLSSCDARVPTAVGFLVAACGL